MHNEKQLEQHISELDDRLLFILLPTRSRRRFLPGERKEKETPFERKHRENEGTENKNKSLCTKRRTRTETE